MKIKDIAWLAGLLEGEGCFGFVSGSHKTIRVNLTMTDEDVVTHAAELMGSKVASRPQTAYGLTKYGKRKKIYATALYSNRAASMMMTLFTFLGKRRRETITIGLADWKQRRLKNPTGMGRRNPRRPSEVHI